MIGILYALIYLVCAVLGFVILVLVMSHVLVLIEPRAKTKNPKFESVLKRLDRIRDDWKFIKAVIDYLLKNYPRSSYFYDVVHFYELFQTDLGKVLGLKKLPCHFSSAVVKYALLETGRCKESDIKAVHTSSWLFAHVFIRVRIGGKWSNVDPAAYSLGFRLGQRLPRFRKATLKSIFEL